MIHNTIELPNNKGTVMVDASDYPLVAQGTWFLGKGGYAIGRMPGSRRQVSMHRLLMGNPVGDIDHINGNRLDNRKSANLRIASRSQNQFNKSKPVTNQSGFKGVYWHKRDQRWYAEIRAFGRKHNLGLFETPKQAAEAYDRAARELHGEFARTNFPLAG